ncbi:MAG TPA: IS110 family transposase [Trebonia sp.]|nr:IS110 family transposase [Trebonia sp.]
MSVYVGIDVHRKRSQVAVIDEHGEVLANRSVPNGVKPVLSVIGELPAGTPAAYEAAFGWGWLLELLEGYGFEPHMVHPLQCKAIASARLKNDKVDAATLAQLLRADLLPEAWIAPPEVRQLRALLRHRAQLVRLRTLLRNRVRAVLAGHGYGRPAGCWNGAGRAWLASLELPAVSREVIDDALALMDALQQPIDRLDEEVRQRAKADPRVKVLTPLPGVGMVTALVLLAEIGDITRFGSARQVASWAGLTPTVAAATARSTTGTSPSRDPPGRAGYCARPRRPPSVTRTSLPALRPSPAAAAGRSPPPRSPASSSPASATCSPTSPMPAKAVHPANGEGRQPRASSRLRMSRPRSRAR